MEETKLIGQVSWFDEKKGFGVINYQDDNEVKQYFAHHSEICLTNNIFKALYKDETVEFIHYYDESKKKLIATKICGVNGNKLTCEENSKTFKKDIQSKYNKNKKPKNTESFKPDHTKSDMCVKFGDSSKDSFDDDFCVNDVILVNNFLKQSEREVFDSL